MREIKFRAWDKKHKEMCYIYPTAQTKKKNTNLMVMDLESIAIQFDGTLCLLDECGAYEYMDEREYIIMQYTGLKDKNGKEIYEGDIVKCGKFFWKIYYRDGMACFWCENIYDDSFEDALFCLNYYKEKEVIGNIYENPVLLKG